MTELDFIDSYDACQLLHISERTLARLVKRGVLKVYHLEGCRKNYYSKSQIAATMRTTQGAPP